jgi:hypothetical protein
MFCHLRATVRQSASAGCWRVPPTALYGPPPALEPDHNLPYVHNPSHGPNTYTCSPNPSTARSGRSHSFCCHRLDPPPPEGSGGAGALAVWADAGFSFGGLGPLKYSSKKRVYKYMQYKQIDTDRYNMYNTYTYMHIHTIHTTHTIHIHTYTYIYILLHTTHTDTCSYISDTYIHIIKLHVIRAYT